MLGVPEGIGVEVQRGGVSVGMTVGLFATVGEPVEITIGVGATDGVPMVGSSVTVLSGVPDKVGTGVPLVG